MDDDEIREELEELRSYRRPLDLQVDELATLLEEQLMLRSILRKMLTTDDGLGPAYFAIEDGVVDVRVSFTDDEQALLVSLRGEGS